VGGGVGVVSTVGGGVGVVSTVGGGVSPVGGTIPEFWPPPVSELLPFFEAYVNHGLEIVTELIKTKTNSAVATIEIIVPFAFLEVQA
jgi:hypothetical protein